MTITAKYPGRCNRCGGAVRAGESVEWSKGSGVVHAKCATAAEPVSDNAITLSGGSGYGCHGFAVGQVVHNHERRIAEGQPEWLYILSTTQRYYREDGMSFGVGDDTGYIYIAKCRPATEQESAPARAAVEAVQKRQDAQDELAKLTAQISASENYVTDGSQPTGDRIGGGPDIYGGGEWFVIDQDRIWYVSNNGMDGDDWSRNNVRTGGAGAIGYAVPYTDELAGKIRDLIATI